MKHLLPLLLLALTGCGVAPIHESRLTRLDQSPVEFAYIKKQPPTVVFISGLGVHMDHWRGVYETIGVEHAVFAYNRYGYGRSGERAEPQTGDAVVQQLHTLLQQEQVSPPYLLVAHSIGGLYANLYARSYPAEVAGVVFVDASHPEQRERFAEVGLNEGVFSRWVMAGLRTLAPTMSTELTHFDTTANQIAHAPRFPPIPVTVITAAASATNTTIGTVWDTLQKDLAHLSPRGVQYIAPGTTHNMMDAHPEAVSAAIRKMLHDLDADQ